MNLFEFSLSKSVYPALKALRSKTHFQCFRIAIEEAA